MARYHRFQDGWGDGSTLSGMNAVYLLVVVILVVVLLKVVGVF